MGVRHLQAARCVLDGGDTHTPLAQLLQQHHGAGGAQHRDSRGSAVGAAMGGPDLGQLEGEEARGARRDRCDGACGRQRARSRHERRCKAARRHDEPAWPLAPRRRPGIGPLHARRTRAPARGRCARRACQRGPGRHEWLRQRRCRPHAQGLNAVQRYAIRGEGKRAVGAGKQRAKEGDDCRDHRAAPRSPCKGNLVGRTQWYDCWFVYSYSTSSLYVTTARTVRARTSE